MIVSASLGVSPSAGVLKMCVPKLRESSVPQVQARCYQLLLSVFQHSSRALSTPYIHALAPLMVEKLKAVERSRPGTVAELQAVQEGIRVLENLVNMSEEQNRKCASA